MEISLSVFWKILVLILVSTQNGVNTTPCSAVGPVAPDCVDCGTVTAGTPEELDCICNGEVPGTCGFCEDGDPDPCLNCTDQPDNPACVQRCEDDPTAEGCPPVSPTFIPKHGSFWPLGLSNKNAQSPSVMNFIIHNLRYDFRDHRSGRRHHRSRY